MRPVLRSICQPISQKLEPRTSLVKGAAGQAIQNFNIACGFDEKTGLDFTPIYP